MRKPFTPAILIESVRAALTSKIPAQSETNSRLSENAGIIWSSERGS
jgi:hypothetical protein